MTMVARLGSQVGILAFAAAILLGLHAGNGATTILFRAIVAGLCGMIIGQFAAWAGQRVLRDHLVSRKIRIDQEYLKAIQAMSESASDAAEGAST